MGLISLCNSQEIEAVHGFVVLQRPQAPLKAKSQGWVEMRCMLLTQRFNFQQERSGEVLYFLVSSCQGGMSSGMDVFIRQDSMGDVECSGLC